MASIDKYLKDPEYTNWVKSGLALNITHEVLRPFVVKEITKLQQSIVKKLPPGVSCGGCSVNYGCPNGICDKIQHEIENEHWYPIPSFTNTSTGRWSTEPWEIAKCYMPPFKEYRRSSASDADFSASINVIINCRHFLAFGTSNPKIKETVYSKSRDFRNRVMHAGHQKVTEKDMRENLDILIDILNKIKTPETEDDTKEAIAKIQKTIQMKITIGDAIEMGKNATEASADKPEKDEDQVQRERIIANFEAGCRKALCRIAEEHISKQKGNLSVAAFLSKIDILAVIKNLCSKHKEILFPESDTHEDIREWDLFVYCFILEELDLSEPLENAVSMFVQEVKTIRNNLLLDATGVTQDDLSELCNYLIDTDLNTEITDIFNKDSPDVDVIRSFNSLESWWRQEEEYGNKRVSKTQLNETKQALKEHIEECNRRFAEHEKAIQTLLEKREHEGENVTLQGANTADIIIDAESELRVRGCDEKTEEDLQEHITSPDNNNIERNEAFDHFLEQINLLEVNPVKGSIILNVKCSSITNVIDFWDSCMDGRAVEALSKVRDYYRRYFKCDTLEFDVILTKKGVSRCVNKIVEGLSSRFDVLVDNVTYKVQEILKAKDNQPIPGLGKDSMVVDAGSDILVKSGMGKGIKRKTRQTDRNQEREKKRREDDDNEEVEIVQLLDGQNADSQKKGKPSLSLHEETDIKTEEDRTKEENQFKVDEMGDTNPDILFEQFPTLAGMHELDEKSMRIYLNALEKGKENLKHIRLMVVGMFGVGKTCLVRRLQNEDTDDVRSTEGIEINVNVCEINEDEDCWTKSEGVHDSDIDGRVNDVLLNTTLDQQEEPKPGQIEENREVKAISILKKKEEGTDKKISRFVKRPIASGRKPTVSLWDFAGQSVYYSTHHFFLSSRSIYVLVLDISKRLDEEVDERYECFGNLQGSMKKYTCLDAFKFWVTSIYAYTQYQYMNEDKGGRNQPTIVLVGTHGDKLEVKDKGKDKEKQKDDYFEKALESFNDPIMKMFHKKSFLVSCTEDENTVFNEIKVEIYKIAKAQTYWNEGTPAKWLPLERSIEQIKKSKNKLMKFDDVKEADAGNELTLDDIEEIKLFLKIQHFLGKVMYFNAKGLDDTVILNPQWIIDIFKLFVNHKPLLCIPKQIQDLWKEYKRTAKLTQPLLDYFIDHSAETTEGKENQLKEHRMQVVGYMEHLGVIAKPVSPKPQVNPEATIPKEIESNKDEDFYFVPCMLKQLTAAEEKEHDVVRQLLNLKNPVTGISTPVLCFVFNCKCLPPSIFHRLLATYIKKLEIKRQMTEDYTIYNDFGAFKLNGIQTLCIWHTEFIIYARVKLHDSSKGVLYTDECIALRKELEDILLSILLIDQQNHPQSNYHKGAFTLYIKCEHLFKECPPMSPKSEKSNIAMDGLHKVSQIEQETVNCSCSISRDKDHSISSDKALEYWYKEPKHLEHISAWFKRKEKDQGFLSEKPHSDDDFSELDKYLPAEGEEFYKLGELLELADNTIKVLSKSGAVELIKKWTKQGKDENTWGLLKEKLYILKEEINRHH